MQWYILQVFPGSENKVATTVKDKMEEKGFATKIGQILVPSVDTVQIRYGKKTNISKPVISGYIMIEMDLTKDVMGFILGVNRVMGFTGAKDKITGLPFPVSSKEVDKFINSSEKVGASENHVEVDIGEEVLITTDPFKDFKGVVEKIDPNNKVTLAVSILGRQTSVELSINQIKKLD